MNKSSFDEMQTQKRNHIGNQSFILLVYLLLIDTFLFNIGIRWLSFPTDIFLIILICSGYYTIRCILCDAFVAPRRNSERPILILLGTTVVFAFAVAAVMKFIKPATEAHHDSGIGAILLMAVSWGMLAVAAVIYLIRRHIENRRRD